MNLELLRQTRRNLIRLTDDLSKEQLLAAPPSFGNNILWNFGHGDVRAVDGCSPFSGRASGAPRAAELG